ncbi:uncharacterized protein JCM15063_000295 [Sporobolomyces koalae]|uniref:uncharacterized protein n=1 Tax=Sporobolomyces koalae TaxID=500713 RepID=UPI003171E33F
MSSPVTSNQTVQSAVIQAPLAKVWHLVKLQDFAKWWSALESSQLADKGVSSEADVFTWKFKDGTSVQVKQEEHSSLRHSITYSVITAEPALSFSSVLSTITLYSVTADDTTFIEWSGVFSSDADASVVEDGKYKRKEALADLAKAVQA